MKIIPIIVLTTLGLLAGVSSHAQPCKINGTITDKYTGEPIIGANAFLLGTHRGAATNIDGEFVIDSLEAGMYTIMFTYIGYLKDSAHVSLVHGETTSLEIALKDDPHIHYDHRDIPVVLISDKPNYNRVLDPSDAIMMFYGVGRWD